MRIAISVVMDIAKSGAWHVVKNIILQLKEIDKENEYIIYAEKTFDNDFGELPENWKVVKTAVSANRPILNILWHMFILPFHLLMKKVDVIWLPWTSAAFLVKTKPTVLSILDLTEYRLKNHYSPSRMLYRKLMLPLSSRLANKIIAISEFTKSDIVKFLKTDQDKIAVLYCAPGDSYKILDKKNSQEILAEKYSIDFEFLLYVGQIQHPNKNLVNLLHAYNKLKKNNKISHKLVLVGKEHLSSKIVYDTVDGLNLGNDVVFTNYVPIEDLPYFYNTASLFVYPSLFEGFGIPVAEAMACGCAVITSDRASLPEVCGEGGILVDPDNIDDMSDAINNLLTDYELKKGLIQKAFMQVKKFSWRDSAEKLLEVFGSLNK